MDPSKCEDVWSHGQYQCLGLITKGDRGHGERPMKEVVRGPFHQLVSLKVDSVVDKTTIT